MLFLTINLCFFNTNFKMNEIKFFITVIGAGIILYHLLFKKYFSCFHKKQLIPYKYRVLEYKSGHFVQDRF